VTTAILHAAFIPFGPIKDVDIPLDHQTQKNRGFGFVTFEETCVRPESHQPYANQSNLLAKSFGSRPHPVLTSRPFTPNHP
jgi:RNA recognition motif-containing protein